MFEDFQNAFFAAGGQTFAQRVAAEGGKERKVVYACCMTRFLIFFSIYFQKLNAGKTGIFRHAAEFGRNEFTGTTPVGIVFHNGERLAAQGRLKVCIGSFDYGHKDCYKMNVLFPCQSRQAAELFWKISGMTENRFALFEKGTHAFLHVFALKSPAEIIRFESETGGIA